MHPQGLSRAALRRPPGLGRRIETAAFAGLLLAALMGGWSVDVATVLGADEWTRTRASSMATFLFGRVSPTLVSTDGLLFLGVPAAATLLRAAWARGADAALFLAGAAACVASTCAVPLLWAHAPPRAGVNPMADVLVADAVSMWLVHVALASVAAVPRWSVAFGPAVGLALYLARDGDARRPSSLVAAGLVMYGNIGALHRAYRLADEAGHAVLAHTLPLRSWQGCELYAGGTVCAAFLLVCLALPPPRSLWEGGAWLFFVLLLNGNVAAAWVGAAGLLGRPLLDWTAAAG